MAKRVAVYCRVSTADQSIERQARELKAYCEARGWEVVQVFEETASGAAKNRPVREKLMKLARQRKIDVVLALAIDRWGRSTQDLLSTMSELQALGVDFVVPGQVDMTTPSGRMVAGFLAVVAEFERSLIVERVKSGLNNARAKGQKLGRPVVMPAKTDNAMELLESGMSYTQVAEKTGISVSTLVRAKRKMRSAI